MTHSSTDTSVQTLNHGALLSPTGGLTISERVSRDKNDKKTATAHSSYTQKKMVVMELYCTRNLLVPEEDGSNGKKMDSPKLAVTIYFIPTELQYEYMFAHFFNQSIFLTCPVFKIPEEVDFESIKQGKVVGWDND